MPAGIFSKEQLKLFFRIHNGLASYLFQESPHEYISFSSFISNRVNEISSTRSEIS